MPNHKDGLMLGMKHTIGRYLVRVPTPQWLQIQAPRAIQRSLDLSIENESPTGISTQSALMYGIREKASSSSNR